jgi:hypothetical protein
MLAIVIPYYKYAFFESTIISLASQTDKRFNVYIGDDASPENPSVLLDRYRKTLNFDYHRFERNLGGTSLVKQWERCIEFVNKEDWIMILGDDDTIDKNFVAEFYTHLDEINLLKINVVRFATIIINEYGERISKIHVHPKLEKSTNFLMRKLKGDTRSSLSEYIFRKSIMKNVGFKNLPLAWYTDLLAVLEFSGFDTVFTINESVVYFRISGLNITSRNDNLIQKNIASFQFYHYLLKEKKGFFDLEQKYMLLERLEKTFLDNKKNTYFWMLFTKLYVSNSYFKKYLLFIAKMLQLIFFKNNNK